jgi:hypothetical protein
MGLGLGPKRTALATHRVWRSYIIGYVSLAVWDIPVGWKWTCYYIVGCGYGLSGLIMA